MEKKIKQIEELIKELDDDGRNKVKQLVDYVYLKEDCESEFATYDYFNQIDKEIRDDIIASVAKRYVYDFDYESFRTYWDNISYLLDDEIKKHGINPDDYE